MMKEVNDSGNAVNVSQFRLMIETLKGFKTDYKPTDTDLLITALLLKWTSADDSQTFINTQIGIATPLIHSREALFSPLSKLVTRSYNHFISLKTLQSNKDSAKSLADSIRGVAPYIPLAEKKAKKNKAAETTVSADPVIDHISTSHMSYVMRVDAFNEFISLLSNEPLYAPNETDLTIASLTTYYTSLKDANNGIGAILTPVNTARIDRDIALYTPVTGIYQTQQSVKAYVIGLYGARSAKTRLITGIKFTNKKIKK